MTTDDDGKTSHQVAEQLLEAFRSVGPFRRRPGFGHAERPGEFQLIHRLSREPADAGLRTGDLAAWLCVKPPTVTRLVDALESRGLVERFADSDDRRVTRVRLSATGRALAGSFRERALTESEALVEHLGVEDSALLADLLSRTAVFLSARGGDVCQCPNHHTHSPDHRGEN